MLTEVAVAGPNDFPGYAYEPVWQDSSVSSTLKSCGVDAHDEGHVPSASWLAILNIEDRRARERAARQQAGKRSGQPARLVEGQRVMGWREALNELDIAYPGRLR
jgi:hypothetical protein